MSRYRVISALGAGTSGARRGPHGKGHFPPLLGSGLHAAHRWVSVPLRLYDSSGENDGAAAVLVTSAERARDLRSGTAYMLSGVQGAGPDGSESV